MKNCECHTEIIRDGSGQLGRYLKALDPAYAKIDERSIDDLLVFAKSYAAQIRFYDLPESALPDNGDPGISWIEFFRRDMAVIAGSIGVTNFVQYKDSYTALRDVAYSSLSGESFAALMLPIIRMAALIDAWYSLAIPQNPLHTDLYLAISSNLRVQLQKTKAYAEGFTQIISGSPLTLDFSAIKNDLWAINDPVSPDTSIYQGDNNDDKVRYAILYVDDIFNAFYGFLKSLIEGSDKYLQYALEKYPSHQPHMALFITFVQLFTLAQEQANELTGRMLNYYYHDVLRLEAKPSLPDHAYIVFELAKGVAEYDISKGTELKATKDASGKDQIYITDGDMVVNQARVAQLKTIFIDKGKGGSPAINSIFARPIANSGDGNGGPFTDPSLKWPTFGVGAFHRQKPKNICQAIDQYFQKSNRDDDAKIGFAFASPQLVLQGGRRLLAWALTDFEKFFSEKLQASGELEISLTGEKDWLELGLIGSTKLQTALKTALDSQRFDFEGVEETEGYFIFKNTIYIYLPIASPSIIAFDPKVHKSPFYQTPYPVLQVLVGPDLQMNMQDFANLSFSGSSLSVLVGSINKKDGGAPNTDGLKKLLIIDGNGRVTQNKNFDPFTLNPLPGANFYIGSNEIFNKPLTALSVNIRLLAAESAKLPILENLAVSLRERKDWAPLNFDATTKDFTLVTITGNILGNVKDPEALAPRTPLTYNSDITSDTYKGFIQIELVLNRDMAEQLFKTVSQVPQQLAQQWKIKEVSLSYFSTLDTEIDPAIDQFFHVYPFGTTETNIVTGRINPAAPIAMRRGEKIAAFEERLKADARKRELVKSGAALLRPDKEFALLAEEKDDLIVDARQKLLPQFCYVSPLDKLNNHSYDIPIYKKILGQGGDIDWSNQIIPLMIEASGISEKEEPRVNQYVGAIQEEGMLFIGIENLKPLQSVSLLFQFADGSAEDEDDDPPPLHWWYVSNNDLCPLKQENIVSDSTFGFQTTGIVKINAPADITSRHTILPDGLVWFCASVTEYSNRFPMLVDVVAQAAPATFTDNNNDPSHFDQALAAGSISALVTPAQEINSVKQPFASFDGKPKETGRQFYTRVSERLRHKARAITAWDYEHLILDRFPNIYKVKCITHTDPNCLCPTYKKPRIPKAPQDCEIKPLEIEFKKGAGELGTEEKNDLGRLADKMKKNENCLLRLIAYCDLQDEQATQLVEKRFKSITDFLPAEVAKRVDQVNYYGDATNSVYCIPRNKTRTDGKVCCGPQVAPGHVLVIPISNLKSRNAVNPLQPKTSRLTLIDIENYLKKRTSPFVQVRARNPVYEQVLVYFKVKFYPGYDIGYYLKQLNDDIVHYLTPWAFDDTAEVKFGQEIFASSIINFIEERPYVDFITDFLMFVCRDACCPPKCGCGDKPDELEAFKKDTMELPASKTAWFTDKEKAINAFNELCGCTDVEYLLQDRPSFIGEVVAKPSSGRSLLVSAPHHIIIPFEDELPQPPCEKRKRIIIPADDPVKVTPAAPTTRKRKPKGT